MMARTSSRRQVAVLVVALLVVLSGAAAGDDHESSGAVEEHHGASEGAERGDGAAQEHEEEHGGHEEEAGANVEHGGKHTGGHRFETLFVPMGAVLAGAAVLHLTSLRCLRAVPAPVLIFLLGIGFGVLASEGGLAFAGGLRRSYETWAKIDPHLVLFTFLPPLVFGEAVRLDTHLANRAFGQCLILAGHGAVFTAFATAALFHWALPYQWALPTCVVAGALLASIDAGSIVEILEDRGAAPLLIMQIRGESMLSDGTVLVLFNIAYSMVAMEGLGVGEICLDIAKSFFGAFAVGGLIGYVFLRWIRTASDRLRRRNSWIQILLTIACAYWSYMLAEGICEMSGVVSTVAAGSVLARHAWPVIVEKQAMIEVWNIIGLVCKSLVFFLAGMLTGRSAQQHSAGDYYWVVATYVALSAIRFLMLLAFWAPMNLVGERLRFADIVGMWSAGLRGIVALCLAMVVSEDRAGGHLDTATADKILFHVSGVVTLTLVVNTMTAPLLFGFFGVTQRGDGRKALVRHVARRARSRMNHALLESIENGSLSRHCSITSVFKDIEEVRAGVKKAAMVDMGRGPCEEDGADLESGALRHGPHAHPDVDRLWSTFRHQKRVALSSGGTLGQFKMGKQLGAIHGLLREQRLSAQHLSIVREVFLEAVRTSYWEQAGEGSFAISPSHVMVLIDSIDMARGRSDKSLADWDILRADLHVDRIERGAGKPQLDPTGKGSKEVAPSAGCRGLFSRGTMSGQMLTLQLIEAFVRAHEHAQAEIAAYFGRDASVDSAEEAFVILESQCSVFAASALHASISKPVQRCIHSTQESYRLCTLGRDYIIAAHERGVLRSTEAEDLVEPIAEVMRRLSARSRWKNGEIQREFGASAPRALHEVEACVRIQRAYRRSRMLHSIGVAAQASTHTSRRPSRQ
mmetsp:Transcript_68510/g.198757  ORF Transcript_68510/g.198757 Transcript_68510/m.198757 type:complete len:916 (-) Transcript_68510:150-2897(-)